MGEWGGSLCLPQNSRIDADLDIPRHYVTIRVRFLQTIFANSINSASKTNAPGWVLGLPVKLDAIKTR